MAKTRKAKFTPALAKPLESPRIPDWLGRLLDRRGFRVLAVLAAGVVAHAGCLGAVFYLDDTWQIQDSSLVEGGQWWADPMLLLTNLSYYLTWRVAGLSSAAFHAGNLGLHLATALSIYWLARHLLAIRHSSTPADWETVAWLAALIFAVHPLNSEVTHYARARDHELVGLFTFLAAGCSARALRESWRWSAAVLVAVLGATFSKGPGLPHALLAVTLVVMAAFNRERWRTIFSNRTAVIGTVASLVLMAVLVSGRCVELFQRFVGQEDLEEYGFYALTQCRVLPQYLWRMLLPLDLCSDHLVASTKSFSDIGAWFAAGALLALVGGVGILWRRRLQPWALLIALALGAMLLRWLYVVSEMMVEYRTYPAMPFVAILFAAGLWRWRQHQPRMASAVLGILLLGSVILLQRRSGDWCSLDAQYAQILRLYPLQLRAMNGLSQEDLRQGRYEAVLKRYPEFARRYREARSFTSNDPDRGYQTWPLWFIFEECAVAEALAHTRGPLAARTYHQGTAEKIRAEFLENELTLAGEWHFSAGKIALVEGDLKTALRELILARACYRNPLPVDREIRKIVPAY